MTRPNDASHSDEKLSAYLDGELSADDTARLAQEIADDPQLQVRLAAFGDVDRILRETYSVIDETPIPDGVFELIATSKANARSGNMQENVVSFSGTSRKSGLSRIQIQIAAAASIALAVGLGIGVTLPGPTQQDPLAPLWAELGPVSEGSTLYAALEHSPSAIPVEGTAGLTATPVMTFQTSAGATCREFSLSGDSASQQGIACRESGGWHVQFAIAGARRGSPAPDAYMPAGSSAAALDFILDALEAGEPLTVDEERALIRNGWAE